MQKISKLDRIKRLIKIFWKVEEIRSFAEATNHSSLVFSSGNPLNLFHFFDKLK